MLAILQNVQATRNSSQSPPPQSMPAQTPDPPDHRWRTARLPAWGVVSSQSNAPCSYHGAHLQHRVGLLGGSPRLPRSLGQPAGVAGQGPAGDAAHKGPRIAQARQQHGQHALQEGQQPVGAPVADGPQRQDAALPGSPVRLLGQPPVAGLPRTSLHGGSVLRPACQPAGVTKDC